MHASGSLQSAVNRSSIKRIGIGESPLGASRSMTWRIVLSKLVNQASVPKWIEDNWGLPAIANSFDSTSGTLNNMFDFQHCTDPVVYLASTTGQVTQIPDPVVPDSRLPALFAGIGGLILAGGAFVGVTRRRRRAQAAA